MTLRGDFKDLVGQKFGRLTVVCFHHEEERQQTNQRVSIRFWFCKCECGGEKVVSASGLLKKKGTRSCGCSWREWKRSPAGRAVQFKKDSAFRQLLLLYKTDAKRREYSWELTDEQFRVLTSSPCHYTGFLPNREMKAKSGEVYLYNGIDRLDSSVGYVFSNCVPCCTDVNMMKQSLSKERFIELCSIVSERFSKCQVQPSI
jgi:hypothetical protein